jgi:hypothetical protein
LVRLRVNGEVVAEVLTPGEADVGLRIDQGKTVMTWECDGPPGVNTGERCLSFAVCDLEILDENYNPILSRRAIYGQQDASADIDDLLLRTRLHEGGFISVGGILRDGLGSPRCEKMPTSIGSPSFSRPFNRDRNDWYYNAQCRANDIGWFVVSPLSGRRFDALLTGLCNDA